MLIDRLTLTLVVIIVSGCVAPLDGRHALQLEGSDDAAAATELGDYLRQAGQPVELSSDALGVFVYRRGMATLLTPVLQNEGLDRIVATRVYGPAPGRGADDLADLAARLNASLNVGVFSVEQGALAFQTQLGFVDRVSREELLALLDWLDSVEVAIATVDGDAGTLGLTAKAAPEL
ncbi:MAG: hypothetical protein WBN65_09435 [Gammaproteobacteria bacterium]